MQLVYDAEKARGEGCAFVESLQWVSVLESMQVAF